VISAKYDLTEEATTVAATATATAATAAATATAATAVTPLLVQQQ
jgi:hypothetical protein